MHLRHLIPAALAVTASAQSLNATLANNTELTNLTSYLALFPGLGESLNNATNITVLAPSNDALTAYLSSAGSAITSDLNLIGAILYYHVLNGTYSESSISDTASFIPSYLTDTTYTNVTGGQRVEAVKVGNSTSFYGGLLQNATVSQANLNFSGGVIHIVDNLLTLPENVTATGQAFNLTALTGALNTTNLIDTIDTTRDLTIFAPNNEAFQSVSSALTNLSTTELADILQYHVVNGTEPTYSPSLTNGTSFTTLNGAELTVYVEDSGDIFVNGAKVVTPNVLVANGVIHIIDNVLNPSNTTLSPTASATTGVAGFTVTSTGTAVPFTSGQPTPTSTITSTVAAGGGASSTAAASSGASGGAASSSSAGAAVPARTGAVGVAALLGAGAVVWNY